MAGIAAAALHKLSAPVKKLPTAAGSMSLDTYSTT